MRIAIRREPREMEDHTLRMRSQDTLRRSNLRPENDWRPLDCPCCNKPLAARTLHGVTLAVCGDCGGIWLEAGQMPILLERGPAGLHPLIQELGLPVGNVEAVLETGHSLHCPCCHVTTEGGPYAYNLQARVDHCPECGGTWVGAGELAAIVEHRAFLRRGPEAPRSRVAIVSYRPLTAGKS